MSWELSLTQRGAIMAEHSSRKDDNRRPDSAERCRFMEHERGWMMLDYMPGKQTAVRPCVADYQELADVTGIVVKTGTADYAPRGLVGRIMAVRA